MPKVNKEKKSRLHELDDLIGDWDVFMSNAWVLDSMETKVEGTASFEWIENAFVLWKWQLGTDEVPVADANVIGYSDAADKFEMFYHDVRGVSRIFDMEFDGKNWDMERKDPDFYQTINFQIGGDTMTGATYASDDQGKTWRKDFDLVFTKNNGKEK